MSRNWNAVSLEILKIIVAPRERRVSRNLDVIGVDYYDEVAPRERRVSRNARKLREYGYNCVAPRERRVSRNPVFVAQSLDELSSRLVRGV